MKKIGKRILSLVLVLAVMLTMTLIPSLAASNDSKLSQSTVRDIRKLDPEVPALFIHGGNDTFIPTFMVNDFYRAKRGIKEKWICPGAGHDQSWLFGIAKYRSVVYEFLSHNGLMKR